MTARGNYMDYDGFLTSAWWAAHIVSPAALVATMAGFFPQITAVVVFCFYVVQLYESKTVQRWLASKREKRLRRLRAKIALLEELDRDDARHTPKGHH